MEEDGQLHLGREAVPGLPVDGRPEGLLGLVRPSLEEERPTQGDQQIRTVSGFQSLPGGVLGLPVAPQEVQDVRQPPVGGLGLGAPGQVAVGVDGPPVVSRAGRVPGFRDGLGVDADRRGREDARDEAHGQEAHQGRGEGDPRHVPPSLSSISRVLRANSTRSSSRDARYSSGSIWSLMARSSAIRSSRLAFSR